MPSPTKKFKQLRKCVYAVVLVLLVHAMLATIPSKKITIAAGPESGTYYQNATAYKKLLEKKGYSVTVIPERFTETIVDKVNDPRSGVDAGFVAQELRPEKVGNVVSMGDIELQPVFLFTHRAGINDKKIATFSDLKGLRVVLPPQRSVTSQAAARIFALSNIDENNTVIEYHPLDEGIRLLKEGKFDAGIFILGADNKLVVQMALSSDLNLVEVGQIDALVKNIRFLQRAVLPAGIYDRERNIPSADRQLLAARVSIIARKDLPPATAYALLEAMSEVHRGGNYVSQPREFPSYVGTNLPLYPLAPEFYRSGTPWIYANLPSALASIVDKFLVPALALWLLVHLRHGIAEIEEFRHLLRALLCVFMLRWLQRRVAKGKPLLWRESWMVAKISKWSSAEHQAESIKQQLADLKAAADAGHPLSPGAAPH